MVIVTGTLKVMPVGPTSIWFSSVPKVPRGSGNVSSTSPMVKTSGSEVASAGMVTVATLSVLCG